ncbi:hypothetical protein GCM10028817_38070 [Spirosoma pomorum]
MRKYSNEQLSYFSDVAFGYPDKIKKWDEKIAVTIVGACSEADRLDVQTIVREVSDIIGKDKIALVSDQANVFVYFPTLQQDFEREKQGTLGIDVNGFTYPTFSFSDRLTKAKLYVSPALKGRLRGLVLRHEFCHALGLSGHSKKLWKEDHLLGVRLYDSIDEFEEVDSIPAVIPEADIMAIKLLYDNSIPNGLKKSTFMQYLKKQKL